MSGSGRGGNLVALGLVQAFRMGASTVVNVIIMRALGVEGFGVYGYVSVLVSLASFAATMGMDRLLKREIARDPAAGEAMLSTASAAVGGLSVSTTVVVLAWAQWVDGRETVVVSAGLAGLAAGLQAVATVPTSYFHAIRQMGHGVLPSFAGRLVFVGATAAFLLGGLDVRGVFAAAVLDGATTLLGAWWAYRRLGQRWLGTSVWRVRALLRQSVSFGLNGLFGNIYLNGDVLLLAWLRGEGEVGLYRAAVMFIALFPIVADTFTTGLYPRMARHLGQPGAAAEELRFAARVLIAVSLPAAVGGALTARPLMVFVGGASFAAAAPLFMVMAPLLPLRFLNNALAMTLSALDRQDDRTRGVFFAACFNIGVNLLVIPRHGALGTAATTLLTEVLLYLWFAWRTAPLVGAYGLGETLGRVGVAALGMGVSLWLLPTLHVVFTITLGGLIYLGLALLTGAVHRGDLSRLRRV